MCPVVPCIVQLYYVFSSLSPSKELSLESRGSVLLTEPLGHSRSVLGVKCRPGHTGVLPLRGHHKTGCCHRPRPGPPAHPRHGTDSEAPLPFLPPTEPPTSRERLEHLQREEPGLKSWPFGQVHAPHRLDRGMTWEAPVAKASRSKALHGTGGMDVCPGPTPSAQEFSDPHSFCA